MDFFFHGILNKLLLQFIDAQEIFRLTVAAFEQLPHVSSRCYTKAVSILETVAKIRSCLVMLDLECDSLVVEMFQNFLKGLR